MAKIGEYRLKAYELLYSRPICEYSETIEKKKRLNILIIGNGWMGNEIFKASFWAGQFVNSELNITVASQNALEYGAQILSTKPESSLPALKMYVEQKHYANLRFINIDIEKSLDETGLAPLDFVNNRYNYIVISLGNAEHNWLAATELITQISKAKEGGVSHFGKSIINIFNEFSIEIDRSNRDDLINYGSENDIEINFFGNETGKTEKELNRIAMNINFAYAMKYDQRSNKSKVDETFEKSRIAEFVDSPMDYEVGDVSVVSNFIGSNYSADSSFAAVVHIPMKLAICKEAVPDQDPLDTLKDAIRRKNNLYRKLVAMEHRRWNAYILMRGFRAPTVQEEIKYLYHEGNTHQDKKRLLHICLCDCSEKVSLENNFDRLYHEWIEKKCPKDFPSELDRASLRVHQLTKILSDEVDVNKILESIRGDCIAYNNFKGSIKKLENDEDHSLVLYNKSLDIARAYAISISEKELAMIDEADKGLTPIKVRNARTDFFGLDQQLVEMIPFALWFGLKYKTIITISDGSVTATQDVIIPTLFCAENAVYIGKMVGCLRYKNTIVSYFKSRGENTLPQFVPLSAMDVDSVFDSIMEQLQKYRTQDIVINCVPNRSYDVALAVGKAMEKYPGKISVVQYLSNKGIVSYSEDKNIGVGLDNKNYSLSEFIQLMGGCVSNEYSSLYDSSQYENLMKLFQNYCTSFKVGQADDKEKKFNPWAHMTKLFSTVAKDVAFEEHHELKSDKEISFYQGKFSKKVFLESRIGKTLKQLQKYRIIQNYKEKYEGDSVWVKFDHVNRDLTELLQTFEEGTINDKNIFKVIKFIPLNGGLKIKNRLVQDAVLYDSMDSQKLINAKIGFMKEISQRGYILNLSIKGDGTMSFSFKDEPTMHLLKNQGAIFELIVYYLMRESGQFDDVETGVKITWDTDEEQPEQVLLDELKSIGLDSIGYSIYKLKRQEIVKRYATKQTKFVTNEVDVIGIAGMSAVMVSCKTSENTTMQWIYEIKSVSDHFQSYGVMAISSDYGNKSKNAFKERAKQMNVSILGTETLWNPEKLQKALQDVVKQSQR
ncbi:MAG: hypothetical protein RR370_02850 [Synergistaceae bacterium]